MVLPPFAKALERVVDGPEMGGGPSSAALAGASAGAWTADGLTSSEPSSMDCPGLVDHSSPLTAYVEERAGDMVGSAFACEPFPRGEG